MMRWKTVALLCVLTATSCGKSTSPNDDKTVADQTIANAMAAASDQQAHDDKTVVDQTIANAMAAASDQQAHVDQIGVEMAALAGHQAENPARIGSLINSCQSQLGVRMEGEGAYAITKCVNRRWNEVGDLTDAARSAGYDDATAYRLGQDAAAICNGDPECLK